MTDVALSTAKWREIAQFWRRLATGAHTSFEASLRCAADGLKSLMRGSHLLLVVQLRVEPDSAAMRGFQPVFSRDFGPDADARLQITREWATHEPRLADDPILRQSVAGQGTFRVVRHRADLSAEEWEDAPVRRLLAQLKLEDRANAIVPLGPDVEVSFCVDRPQGEPIFDDGDRQVFRRVIEGLRPLAAQFVRCHGYMPGQRPLDEREQQVMARLLSPATEAEIAQKLELDLARFEQVAEQVYAKLGVARRLELTHLWLHGDGAEPVGVAPRPQVELPSLPDARAPLESGPLIPRVRQAIARALSADEFGAEAVAGELGMSVRSLQRDLRNAGTSFRELAEDGRRNRAEVLLSRPWLNFTEIAMQLGYSQVSSFNRAVKRWTGATPSQLRRALLEQS